MKKLSFLALAAVGLLLSACTDKNEEVNTAQLMEEFTDGGYIGISLQLPSADQSITRAEETGGNDILSNGTEDEFEVKNATLYIFRCAKATQSDTPDPDKDATYVGYVTLGTSYAADKEGGIDPDEWGEQNGVKVTNITSTYSEAAMISNALASEIKNDTDNDYYAYVILNHNGQVPAATKDVTTFKTFSQTEFKEIGADIAAAANIHEGGLLMTNAPICDKSGGSAAPASGAKYTTLVKLDNSKIYQNKQDATDNPAGCVYVERAAVKITVEDGRTTAGNATTIGDYNVTIDGWQVINYEKSYYNTRQIETAWGAYTSDKMAQAYNKYRFVSAVQFLPTLPTSDDHTIGFRTYFAKDPHFNTDASAAVEANPTANPPVEAQASTLGKTVASSVAADWIAVGSTNHAYTTENTFDVGRQTWRNTTMVTLKVTMSKTETGNTTPTYPDFYTVGKGSQTMLATADDAKAAIQNIVKNDPTVTAKYKELLDKISANNPDKNVQAGLTVNFTAPTAAKTDVPFTISLAYTIDGAAATYSGNGESALKTALENAITAVLDGDDTKAGIQTSDAVLLSYYKGGVSYYNVRIKHFGDVETPWSATGNYISGGGKDVKEIYAYDITKDADNADNVLATNRFLGRYGVVRDNWYKLSIDKIGTFGTAEPVDPSKTTPDTPDDEIENYISVHVHIVPWVLRRQSVEF